MGLEELIGDDTDDLISSLAAAGDDDDIDAMLEAGIDEIIGDDDDFDDYGADQIIAGATPRQQADMKKLLGRATALAKKGKAVASAAAKKKKLQGLIKLAVLKRSKPTILRQRHDLTGVDLPVSFASAGNIAGGASQLILIQAPTIWSPNDLTVPSDIASLFAIAALTMGLYTFNPSGQPLRMLSFTEEATTRRGWKLPTLQPGQTMNMLVTNVSGTTSPCYGEWWGKMVG